MFIKNTKVDNQVVQRSTNIELLRIVAMIMIVAHHFAVHSRFDFSDEIISFNRLWIMFVQLGGKIGVNIFLLITGYFLISADSIKVKKIVKLWIQMFTWSVLIYCIFVFIGKDPFRTNSFFKNCLPVTYEKWWFASTYFCLYIVFPYINKLLRTLNKRQYLSLLILINILWCVLPTITRQLLQSNNLLWFIYIYSVAGYIKLYGIGENYSSKMYIVLSILAYFMTFIISVLFIIGGLTYPTLGVYATHLYEMRSIPVVIISVLLFSGFTKLRVGHNKITNIISSSTFGVYLIHDHPFVRSFIWLTLFKNDLLVNNQKFVIYSIIEIIIVFGICVLLELMRKTLIEKPCLGLIDSLSITLEEKKENFLDTLIRNS